MFLLSVYYAIRNVLEMICFIRFFFHQIDRFVGHCLHMLTLLNEKLFQISAIYYFFLVLIIE